MQGSGSHLGILPVHTFSTSISSTWQGGWHQPRRGEREGETRPMPRQPVSPASHRSSSLSSCPQDELFGEDQYLALSVCVSVGGGGGRVVVRETQCAKSPYGEGEQRQSPWQEATVSSPGHLPLSQAGPAPCSSSAVFPRCQELPGLVCEGWDRIPALTALVPARQALFMLGR